MAPLGNAQSVVDESAMQASAALPDVSESVPVESGWSAPAPTSARKRLPLRRIILVLMLVAVAVSAYAFYRLVNRTAKVMDIQLFTVARRSFPVILKEKGELKAANSIDVRSEVEGRATIIYLIPEGQHVEKGELLIEMASDEIDTRIRDTESVEAKAAADYEAAVKSRDIQRDEDASKIRKAELQLRLAKLAEEKYTQGEKKEAEQEATLAVDKASMVLQREEQDHKDAQELFDQGFITRVELKDAEFNHYAAGLDVAKAKLALEVLNKYTIPMELESKGSDVHEAEKELDRVRKAADADDAKATADVEAKKSTLAIVRERLAVYRDQKIKTRILAPAAGLVVYARENSWRSESTIETGVEVHERQMLIQLPDTTSMKAEVRIHEAQIEQLEVGMPATVAVEGFTNQMFPGKVAKIAVMADSQNYFLNPNLREYKTDVLLEGRFGDGGPDLKPNTTARVEIQVAQMSNVLAVPVQAVFAKGGRCYVFLDDHGTARPVPVEPGVSSTDFVEIKSGLSQGQSIRLAITDDMQLLLPDEGEKDLTHEDGSRRAKKPTKPKSASRPADSDGPGSRPAEVPGALRAPEDRDASGRSDHRASSERTDRGDSPIRSDRRDSSGHSGRGDSSQRVRERGGVVESQPASREGP